MLLFSLFLDRFAWLATPKRKHVIENYPFLPISVSLSTCEQKPINWIGYIQFCHISFSSRWVFLAFVRSIHSLCAQPWVSFRFVSYFFFSFLLSLFQFNVSLNNYCLLPLHSLLYAAAFMLYLNNAMDGSKWAGKQQRTTKETSAKHNNKKPRVRVNHLQLPNTTCTLSNLKKSWFSCQTKENDEEQTSAIIFIYCALLFQWNGSLNIMITKPYHINLVRKNTHKSANFYLFFSFYLRIHSFSFKKRRKNKNKWIEKNSIVFQRWCENRRFVWEWYRLVVWNRLRCSSSWFWSCA